MNLTRTAKRLSVTTVALAMSIVVVWASAQTPSGQTPSTQPARTRGGGRGRGGQPLPPVPDTGSFYQFLYPNNDLGAVYTPQATTIKLWAPTAKAVNIDLFDDASIQTSSSIPMSVDKDGIWSATLQGDMDGKYYLYDITHPGTGQQTTQFLVNDLYAHGSSANSGRTLIYDPAKTNPPGWDQDHFISLKQNVDAVLYEVHIRDFSIGAGSGVSADNRGKYMGMVEGGTKNANGEKTDIDHLVELGITHVHLMPMEDYAGGDERQKADAYTWYNWGYETELFDNPEGSYASNPDGTARQKEVKEMVQAFHQHHLGVVMDVVYNHTASTGTGPTSIFDKILPYYYYRRDASGRYANGTGVGNEVASEKPMVRKFIVDSIKYWMTEYHVDGFRFDLMGIEDRDTMQEVYKEAKKIDPSVIIYGEGWKMERVLPAQQMMTQANVKETGLAAFNDGIRDNIKGPASNGATPGFVQGAGPRSGMDQFLLNIKGQSTGGAIEVSSPNETINYDSVHDDNCLWDKLLLSAPNVPDQLRYNMDKLAAGIVLTSQGVPFLHAGDEFLRSKNLNKNSYNSNDPQINPINWSLKSEHKDVFDFYKGMIALREAHPAFRMFQKADVDRSLEFAKNTPKNVVAYVLRNNANGDTWKNILVVYNGNQQPQDLIVPGNWMIVANDKNAGTETVGSTTNKIHVEACSLIVAYTEESIGSLDGVK